ERMVSAAMRSLRLILRRMFLSMPHRLKNATAGHQAGLSDKQVQPRGLDLSDSGVFARNTRGQGP
ncbi:MAG: hypothetical protein M0O99_08370, partial [Desulfuromonas thiophila]|nr:hypothetical protein [Desulfuromonas thiophila]